MAEEKKNKAGNITISVTSGDFPFHLWKEWESDCKKNFNDIRWAKMWSDHQAAQREKLWASLIEDIESIKLELAELKEEPKKDVVKTFGGNRNE